MPNTEPLGGDAKKHETVHYCIYKNPSDYPNKFVVRKWHIVPNRGPVAGDVLAVEDELHEARKVIPEGSVNMGRLFGDDRAVYETWI